MIENFGFVLPREQLKVVWSISCNPPRHTSHWRISAVLPAPTVTNFSTTSVGVWGALPEKNAQGGTLSRMFGLATRTKRRLSPSVMLDKTILAGCAKSRAQRLGCLPIGGGDADPTPDRRRAELG